MPNEKDDEVLFIRDDETEEQRARKRKLLDEIKARADMASEMPSEEETLPGVDEPQAFQSPSEAIEAIMGMGPNDEEFEDVEPDVFDDYDLSPRVVKTVVYGFYGLSPDDYLEDTWWQMSPKNVFRPESIIAFPVDDFPAIITNIKCGNTEQLVPTDGIPAQAFRCEYTLDLMIDRYFDAKSLSPKGIVYLTGDEIDGRGHGGLYLMLESATPAIGYAVKFTGKLRALLMIGTEVIEPVTVSVPVTNSTFEIRGITKKPEE